MEPKETSFKPKMRVQLLSIEGIVQMDRLVDQSIELYQGAKVSHDGPIKLEVTLQNKDDISKFKQYIDQLSGNLPLKEVGKRGRPEGPAQDFNSPREELLEDVVNFAKGEKNHQDDVILYLRKLGFVFLLTEDFLQYFPEFEFKQKDIGTPNSCGQYPNSYSWMVRRIKAGKDPKTDKYDPQLIFGIKMIGERDTRIIPYLYKERKERIKSLVPKKNALSFNNTEMTKFPHYMREDERLKFSTEMRQLMTNPSKKPSKFYLRWFPDVKFPEAITKQMNEILER